MEEKTVYYVYMLRCRDNSLYTGIATDWQRRFTEHLEKRGAKYTKSHPVERIERVWQAADKIAACKLEYRIKALEKLQKETLITDETTLDALLGDKLDSTRYTVIV